MRKKSKFRSPAGGPGGSAREDPGGPWAHGVVAEGTRSPVDRSPRPRRPLNRPGGGTRDSQNV